MRKINDEQHNEAQRDAAMLLRMAINEARVKRNVAGVWMVIWIIAAITAGSADHNIIAFVAGGLAFVQLFSANSAWKTMIEYTEEYHEKYGQ